jgi:hypothetical protein
MTSHSQDATQRTWHDQRTGEGAKERCLVELVYREAHRNERRINDVKMVLVALGIVMSLVFWMQEGQVATMLTVTQAGVLGTWLLVMCIVALAVRRPVMPRAIPYAVLTVDTVMIAALVVVRMMWMPVANQVHDGVLSEWTFLMLFPVLASAGPRFDRDVSRYAELLVTICTLLLLVFDIAFLGSQPRPFFVLITLLALLATGRFTVMVTDRGRRLIAKAARFGAGRLDEHDNQHL